MSDFTRSEKLTQYDSNLLEELTQFPVKDVLLLILNYVYLPILPTSKLLEIMQFFKMLFVRHEPNLLPITTVSIFDLLQLNSLRIVYTDQVKNKCSDKELNGLRYLFDIESYTNLLFYCTDVFANKSIVVTFAIFYMNNSGYLCVEMEENLQHAEYHSLRVDFILYLCNDLDVLLSDRKLNDRFYASATLNSKEHLPRVYGIVMPDSDAKTAKLAFWSSSHFCFK